MKLESHPDQERGEVVGVAIRFPVSFGAIYDSDFTINFHFWYSSSC